MEIPPFLRQARRRIRRWQIYRQHREKIASYQATIHELCADSENPSFLFAPGLSWNRQIIQRPQQLARALAGLGCPVFYLEPIPQAGQPPFTFEKENLVWCNIPIEAFADEPDLWLYHLTWSIDLQPALPEARLWYDFVDDLSTFEGDAAEIQANHHKRAQQARLFTASANRLAEQALEDRIPAELVPNAVDYEHFASAPGVVPDDLAPALARKRPIIFYHGALAHWFDYELFCQLARRRDDLTFVLVGPAHGNNLAASGLKEITNVFWLGRKEYAELPAYLHQAHVGIIPFRLNEITHATSPIKLFEYFAAGLPVVATRMAELWQYPPVLFGGDAAEFAERIDETLGLRADLAYMQRIERLAKENTWSNRAERVVELIRRFEQSNDLPNPYDIIGKHSD